MSLAISTSAAATTRGTAGGADGLSRQQVVALQAALSEAVAIHHHSFNARAGVGVAARSTVLSLVGEGYLEPRGTSYEEWVATTKGVAMGRQLGLDQRFTGAVPSMRARAIILRALTMPDCYAVGDVDAHSPRRLRLGATRENMWIERLGYGTLVRDLDPRHGSFMTLALTAKGQALVEATDMPIKLALTDEEEDAVRAGTMKYGIVPDPTVVERANFQIESDWLRSPRDLYARLLDPAAIYPGTIIELVRERGGALIGTAKAGPWNRVCLSLLQAYEEPTHRHWHFDASFAYSDLGCLDKGARRVWAPFPEDYSDASVRPREHERQFASDCGFKSLTSMRSTWLRRTHLASVRRGSSMRGWVKGLVVELHHLDL